MKVEISVPEVVSIFKERDYVWRIRYTSWVGEPIQASPLNPNDSAALTMTSLRYWA